MKTKMTILLFLILIFIAGCSAKDDEQKQGIDDDHFLKDKTDVLDDAKKIEQILKESEQRKRKNMEEQTQ